MRYRGVLALGVALAALVAIPSADAKPGALDPNFGSGGKVTTPFTDLTGLDVPSQAFAAAPQPDGKIVAVGDSGSDFGLARYNADGSLDTTFGTNGERTTPAGTVGGLASAVALQPDGKIVVAGTALDGSNTAEIELARYNPDGSLDNSLGGHGTVYTTLLGDDSATGVAIQPDGKIIVAGTASDGKTVSEFALVRYDANGTLDSTFAEQGAALTPMGTGNSVADALVQQPDGKLVVAGYTLGTLASDYNFAVARYTASGTLDQTFGTGGKVVTQVAGGGLARAVALQPDGKIILAGEALTSASFALVRYSTNGSPDTSFGSAGEMITAVPGQAFAIAVEPDGKLVTVGSNGQDFEVARNESDGPLDSSFGASGVASTPFGAGAARARGMVLQPDGKIVAVGSVQTGSSALFNFALARYLGSTLTVTKAGSGAGTVTSGPGGIHCGTTCSTPFAAVPVTLTAAAAAGSVFAGWAGDCTGTGTCKLTMSTDHFAVARFTALCVVPKVKGKKLRPARRAITQAHCSVGRVRRAFSSKVKEGRVISQKPHPGTELPANSKVKLKVSKGKRR